MVNTTARRAVVGVIGSGTDADPRAAELGRWLASLGCDLLTGGGGGVMAVVSQAFFETAGRRGRVIGIIPGLVPGLRDLETRRPSTPGTVSPVVPNGYPNPFVEIAICTHLPDSGDQGTLGSSRNHINVLSSDVLVAFPGGAGTRAEMWLAVQYGVPVIAIGHHADNLPEIRIGRDLEEVKAFVVEQVGQR